MKTVLWNELRLESREEDELWETFHENSKLTRFDQSVSAQEVRNRMSTLYPSWPLEQYPGLDLPERAPLAMSLAEAIDSRVTDREIEAEEIDQSSLAALLHGGYGVTRDNQDNEFPWGFRTVPSAGALYPLELFVHCSRVEAVDAGIYHFSPTENRLRRLREGDWSRQISDALVQPELSFNSSLQLFVTAVFDRTVFKYGSRGYRFALLEAGHVAQNLNLVATGLGLGSVNIGGYLDRSIDGLLGLDGVTHSTVYMVAVGRPRPASPEAAAPPSG